MKRRSPPPDGQHAAKRQGVSSPAAGPWPAGCVAGEGPALPAVGARGAAVAAATFPAAWPAAAPAPGPPQQQEQPPQQQGWHPRSLLVQQALAGIPIQVATPRMQQQQEQQRRLSATYASLPPQMQQQLMRLQPDALEQMLTYIGQQQAQHAPQQAQHAAQQVPPLQREAQQVQQPAQALLQEGEQPQEGTDGGGQGAAAACTCGRCVEGIVSPRNAICMYRAAELQRWAPQPRQGREHCKRLHLHPEPAPLLPPPPLPLLQETSAAAQRLVLYPSCSCL